MIHRCCVLALLAGLSSGAAAEDELTPFSMFGARESISHIDLSPDGKRVVYVSPAPGAGSVALVTDLESGKSSFLVKTSGEPDTLEWCNFVTNEEFICEVGGVVARTEYLVPYVRLIAISESDKKPRLLGQSNSIFDAGNRQFDGAIIDWLPGQDGQVLMSRTYIQESSGTLVPAGKGGLAVDRIDVKTLRSKRLESPSPNAASYVSDGRGNVRMRSVRQFRGELAMLTGKETFHYRKLGSQDWIKFSDVEADGTGLTPVAIDHAIDAAYALGRLDGRYALYRVKLDGSLASELVYSNPRVDVDDVVRIGKGGRVIGVTFVEEKRKTIYFDPEYQKLASALSKTLPNLPLIQFVASSEDGTKILIFAGSDSDPGRYYIFDKLKRALSEVGKVRPPLEGKPLATVKPVSYPSDGGVSIPAYLTLPPGQNGSRLPAIVLPHGGPSARDEWGFDWLAQFLASQGYAVLQPNYRGSAGYGTEWKNRNGFRGWRTSIGDVIAGAKWMADQGIAAPGKLSIVGWSYGGYAALQSAVVDPNLFKAVVAIAPVTDLNLIKQQARHYTNARMVEAEIGDGPHVSEGSPLQNVGRISTPVLMFHGDRDLNVDIDQSRKMRRALESAGKKGELVVYPGLMHGLADTAVRAQMLEKIAAFLEANGAK